MCVLSVALPVNAVLAVSVLGLARVSQHILLGWCQTISSRVRLELRPHGALCFAPLACVTRNQMKAL